MGKFEDLIGQKFGMWTVVSRAENGVNRHARWNCICECGKNKIVYSNHLKSGNSKSCGCSRTKHGQYINNKKPRLFNIWRNMKSRCLKPNNPQYDNYGGRGITICKEWSSSSSLFIKWALENGYRDNLTIDRIDNNKGYFPENCRWTTATEQNRNQGMRKDNTSGYKGICQLKGKWRAHIGVNNKVVYLGTFDTLDEAITARKQAEKTYWNK